MGSNNSVGEEVNVAREEIMDWQEEQAGKGTSLSSSLCNQYLSALEAFDLPAHSPHGIFPLILPEHLSKFCSLVEEAFALILN